VILRDRWLNLFNVCGYFRFSREGVIVEELSGALVSLNSLFGLFPAFGDLVSTTSSKAENS
jgi:hypothetical protein